MQLHESSFFPLGEAGGDDWDFSGDPVINANGVVSYLFYSKQVDGVCIAPGSICIIVIPNLW